MTKGVNMEILSIPSAWLSKPLKMFKKEIKNRFLIRIINKSTITHCMKFYAMLSMKISKINIGCFK